MKKIVFSILLILFFLAIVIFLILAGGEQDQSYEDLDIPSEKDVGKGLHFALKDSKKYTTLYSTTYYLSGYSFPDEFTGLPSSTPKNQEVTVNFLGNEYTGKYYDRNYFLDYEYRYKSNDVTFYMNNGELGYIYFFTTSPSETILEKSEILDLAATAAEQIIDTSKYECVTSEDNGIITVTYTKYIQNIPTEDYLKLRYYLNGELRSADIGAIGAFDDLNFDIEKVNKSIEKKLSSMKKKYNITVSDDYASNLNYRIEIAAYGCIYTHVDVKITDEHGEDTLPLFTKLN